MAAVEQLQRKLAPRLSQSRLAHCASRCDVFLVLIYFTKNDTGTPLLQGWQATSFSLAPGRSPQLQLQGGSATSPWVGCRCDYLTISLRQVALQPSPLMRLESSHSSLSVTLPSPQEGPITQPTPH